MATEASVSFAQPMDLGSSHLNPAALRCLPL
jgi:hypothetical protein